MPVWRTSSVAGDDVDRAGRQLGLAADVGEEERGERRRLGRLQDDRVAARQRRRHLPRQHEEREVPRDDLGGDAERPRAPVREGVLELVGPAGVVEEVRGGQGQVDVARLLDRLAAVQRLGHGQLAASLLDDPGDAEEVLRALGRPQLGPRLESGPGGADRGVDVLGPGLGDVGQRLLGGGGDRREPLAGARLDALAADEEAVALLERDDCPRLGRRGVRPFQAAVGAWLDVSQR
jgi:hypothetical protein